MVPEPSYAFLDAPISASYQGALAGIVNREFLRSERYQQQQWRALRRGAHPDVLEFERLFVKRMAKLGVPVFASEVIRSPERQNELFKQGNSRAKGGQSPHQYGCAVDIVHSTMGWNMEPKAWSLMGHVGNEIIAQRGLGIQSFAWGGDWSFYDPAHWQLADWKAAKGGFLFPWHGDSKATYPDHAAYKRSLKGTAND